MILLVRFVLRFGRSHILPMLSSLLTHGVPQDAFFDSINLSHAFSRRGLSSVPLSNHSSAFLSTVSLPFLPGVFDVNVFLSPSSFVTLHCQRSRDSTQYPSEFLFAISSSILKMALQPNYQHFPVAFLYHLEYNPVIDNSNANPRHALCNRPVSSPTIGTTADILC